MTTPPPTEPNAETKLAVCPFCGGEARSVKSDYGPGFKTSSVNCRSCHAQVAKAGLDAESEWQRRHESDELKRLRKIEAAARELCLPYAGIDTSSITQFNPAFNALRDALEEKE